MVKGILENAISAQIAFQYGRWCLAFAEARNIGPLGQTFIGFGHCLFNLLRLQLNGKKYLTILRLISGYLHDCSTFSIRVSFILKIFKKTGDIHGDYAICQVLI
ncbi:hypothetical protein ES703_77846 [subsurface metagenome]